MRTEEQEPTTSGYRQFHHSPDLRQYQLVAGACTPTHMTNLYAIQISYMGHEFDDLLKIILLLKFFTIKLDIKQLMYSSKNQVYKVELSVK